jgi:hypothetical protein
VDGAARHNPDVTRLALAAIVFASTLCVALVQMVPELAAVREASSSPASALPRCTPDDDEREWRPTHQPRAAITDWAWKWRAPQSGLVTSTIARCAVQGTVPLTNRPPARVTGAPAHLLHIPLLI